MGSISSFSACWVIIRLFKEYQEQTVVTCSLQVFLAKAKANMLNTSCKTKSCIGPHKDKLAISDLVQMSPALSNW